MYNEENEEQVTYKNLAHPTMNEPTKDKPIEDTCTETEIEEILACDTMECGW